MSGFYQAQINEPNDIIYTMVLSKSWIYEPARKILVCVDVLGPSQQFFSHVRMTPSLPGLIQY